MSLYVPDAIPPLVHGAVARIERRLPYPGRILARVGTRVEADDEVARAFVPAPIQIVNVARSLGIAPQRIERAMRREIGNKVAAGDILARSTRIGGRVCHAPVSGVITAVDNETGYVTIAPDPQEMQLRAQITGVVMEHLGNSGVAIETPAAQVFGAFGLGIECNGVLKLLVTDASEPVTPEMIDPRSAYAILIGGSGVTAAALRRALSIDVRGIIVGGIDERELRAFANWSGRDLLRLSETSWSFPQPQASMPALTLMVTEGFGERPMAQPIFELLSSHNGQEALLEPQTRLRGPLHRPRLVIPLSRSAGIQLTPLRPALRPGALVRLLDANHLGQIAELRSIPALPRRTVAGTQVQVVEVMLADGQLMVTPRTALEVLS